MERLNALLLRIPWYVTGLVVAVGVIAGAGATRYFAGPLFYETCENERNLLTGEFEASNCGEGAKIARQPADGADDPGQDGPDGPSDGDTAGVLATGEFEGTDSAHRGSGTAQVQRLPGGSLNLFLSNFSVTNGPDLYVYLVPEGGDTGDGLDLGRLQANNGNQNYAIPAGTDLSDYDRVVIWCRQFDVDFSIAQIAAAPAPTDSGGDGVTASPTPAPSPSASPTAAGPGVLASGSFVDGDPGHEGSGTAEIQRLADGRLNVFLSNFSVTNGPDLVVVLSEDPAGSRDSVSSGLTLDALKANNGNQNYEIPAGTDVSRFKSVIIYCKSFPTIFAYATLGGS